MTMGREITPEVATPKALEGGGGISYIWPFLRLFFLRIKAQEICGSPIVLSSKKLDATTNCVKFQEVQNVLFPVYHNCGSSEQLAKR